MNKYTLPDLPYVPEALEPYISKEIMILHHDKHHQAYINNLNAALEKHPEIFKENPEDLLKDLENIPEDIRMAVRNNGGGHVNHLMLWQIMTPNPDYNEASGELAEEIKKTFGSFNNFQQKFNDEGLKRFGSGWVWLVKNKNGSIEIISTPNQDNPISQGYFPIMGNDVWEHAYYLQYKNVRADYLKAWWNVVHWKEVERRFSL